MNERGMSLMNIIIISVILLNVIIVVITINIIFGFMNETLSTEEENNTIYQGINDSGSITFSENDSQKECNSHGECEDDNLCTLNLCINGTCINQSINRCADDDGCCPEFCSESNDNDCSENCIDFDNDTFFELSNDCLRGNDCNDNNSLINPYASEFCDGKDNNCNGEVDEICYCSGHPWDFCSQLSIYGYEDESQCEENNCDMKIIPWCRGADVNRDTVVNETDMNLIMNNLGNDSCLLINNWCNNLDITKDGVIDMSDLSMVLGNLGKTGCDLEENNFLSCYTDITKGCSSKIDKNSCEETPGCEFKWLFFCLEDSDCDNFQIYFDGSQEKCIENKCRSDFTLRGSPFMNSVWTSSLDILADSAWSRDGPIQTSKLWNASDYLDVIPAGEEYALKAVPGKDYTCNMGKEHCYEKVVIKDFSEPLQTWGGTMYVNLKNVIHYPDTTDVVFGGAYNYVSTTDRDLGIAAYRRDRKSYIYFKSYYHWCSSGASPLQRIQVKGADYYEVTDPWPDRWIRADWFFTPSYSLYARLDEGQWHNITPLGQYKTNFIRFDVGWISSYSDGSVLIKNVSLYNQQSVPQWVLEN